MLQFSSAVTPEGRVSEPYRTCDETLMSSVWNVFGGLTPVNISAANLRHRCLLSGIQCSLSALWLIGRTGQHLRAAIVHDWLIHALDSSNPPVHNRMAADDVFRDLMRADQVSAVRRYLIYLAVRFATMWKRKSTVRRSVSVLLQTTAIGVVLAPATVLVMLTAGLFKLVERVGER